MKIKPYFIVGLGNPGSQYAATYHNVGWLAVDSLIQSLKLKVESLKFKKCDSFQYLKTKDYIFLKPQTFMNKSGKAVAASLRYFKIEPGEILVIHDDSDIKFGKMKLSFGRGAAGHKGVQSIIDELKTSARGGSAAGGKNFWRLRIGIRKAGLPAEAYRAKAGGFVLKKITPADKLALEQLFSDLKIL